MGQQMVLTRSEVAKLAALARIELSDDELDDMATQLDIILASVASVGEVAAQDIPPTSHAVPLVNVMREDVVSWTPNAEGVLAGAPVVEDGRFRVPRILDDDEEA
ncbi:MAG: Asp-tRNA(Asn)/Glu-tRNA(Gln) amidotransferase subunit GatC [Propionibacteriaceae bacterium]|jgi:aspartyl-tRNA(Asn)/glutamyl-tRNA(Gln) amidotransferase subunit C|nr:Asp-tRNA(Asn)/Glu-tRNA(Gln) amidotransferase subunit GatC [Propionibacteriaceae bacterium]